MSSWLADLAPFWTPLLGVALAIVLLLLYGRHMALRLSRQQTQHVQDRLDESLDRAAYVEAQWQQSQSDVRQLDKQLTELQVRHEEKEQAYQRLEQNLEHSKQLMQTEFQNLANTILEEKGQRFQQSNQQALQTLLQPFREQISAFQQRVNQLHDQSLKGQVNLEAEIRRVLDIGLQMSSEAQHLSKALKGDKKLSGIWGELQLERTLEAAGLVRGEHYLSQAALQTEYGNKRFPDFLIKLPENRHMVLDSKTSLVDYERAVRAEDEGERGQHMDNLLRAMRHHMDDLSSKRYDQLPGLSSPDFVFMFVPIEGAYIEAIRHQPELFEYGMKRHVMLVSHATLLPVLRTVANLWMIVRSNEHAHELGLRAADLHDQVVLLADRFKRMGESLRQMNGHFNSTVTALSGQQGVYGKLQRFKELSARSTKNLPALDTQQHDVELYRLDGVATDEPTQPELGDPPRE